MRHQTSTSAFATCAARLARGATRLARGAIVGLVSALAFAAHAQQLATAAAPMATSAPAAQGAQGAPGGPEDAIRIMVERSIGPDQRVEVQFGQLDPRLQLAPCGRVEPFLPPAVRLWGRTSIGLRCVQGANWSVLLPMTIRVYGHALVATTPLAAGTALSAADFRLDEIELTREPAAVMQDAGELDGKVLTRSLAAGQALRRDAMRAPPTVASGEAVKILVVGQGFTIASEGISMGAASEGQKLRVRTESGRVVTGELRGRTVELRL